MFEGNADKLFEGQTVAFVLELFFEHVDCQLVEIEGHICDHAFVLLFYAFVSGAGRVDRVDVQWVFAQPDRHHKFL